MYPIKSALLGLLSITLIQCASREKKIDQNKQAASAVSPAAAHTNSPTPQVTENPPPADEKKPAPTSKELEDLQISLKKAEAITKKDAGSAVKDGNSEVELKEPHSTKNEGAKKTNVPYEKALNWLKNGNTRFVKGHFRNDGASKKDVTRLSSGQAPHSIILSCSDSRVPPEVVFDQKLGEVFVVRTAGESADASVIASIEYAVQHLGASLLVVMGHSSCGAIKASVETAVGGDTGSPYVNALVAEIQPRIAERMKGPASENLVAESWDNARGVAQKLLEKSKLIRDAAKSGSLRIETALYHLDSGHVEWNK